MEPQGAESSVILERRRRSHTEAEQRRRNAIKKGYESLRELVYPSRCNTGSSAIRISKLSILNKAVTDIERLGKEVYKKQNEVRRLEKFADALRVLNTLYDDRLKEISPDQSLQEEPVSEDVKLQIFQYFADSLFNSFDSVVTLASFRAFVDSVLTWLENTCKPESLVSLMNTILPMVLPLSSNSVYSSRGVPYNYQTTQMLPVSGRVSPSMVIPDPRPFDPSHSDWTVAVPVCTRILPSESTTTNSISDLGTQYFKVSKSKQISPVLIDPRELSAFHPDSVGCPLDDNTCEKNLPALLSPVMVTAPPQTSSAQCFSLSESSSKYDYDNVQSRGSELDGLQSGHLPTRFQSSGFPGGSQQSVRNLPSDSDSFRENTAGSLFERFF